MREIKRGDDGARVKAWQEFLTAQGFSLGRADGDFGRRTHAATIEYQRKHGLFVDGVVGPQTTRYAATHGFRVPPTSARVAESPASRTTPPYSKSGLHPDAARALGIAGIPFSRVGQTIGYAAASSGVHARDGFDDGKPYCAAVDIRVRNLHGKHRELKSMLERLGRAGFAAWVREPGVDGWPKDPPGVKKRKYVFHLHAVYAGVPMKAVLQRQVRDYLAGRNGLRSHAFYNYYKASLAARNAVRELFEEHND